jgi:uncharacterized protein (TIGR03435 family)
MYALVMARKDGKVGPRLTEAKEGACTPHDPTKPAAPPELGRPPAGVCGQTMVTSRHLIAVSIPIAHLTPLLSRVLGRPVADKTGLTGNFDVSLDWTPDDLRLVQSPSGEAARGGKGSGDNGASDPPLLTALQQQLGLKLELQKGQVDILVIDRVEKPSAT